MATGRTAGVQARSASASCTNGWAMRNGSSREPNATCSPRCARASAPIACSSAAPASMRCESSLLECVLEGGEAVAADEMNHADQDDRPDHCHRDKTDTARRCNAQQTENPT